MSETVYVLGAGFSVCGGAPTQRQILPELFNNRFHYHNIEDHRNRIRDFLENTFSLDCNDQQQLNSFPLEDIFTLLDRSIINRQAFRQYDEQAVDQLRRSLGICINSVMFQKLENCQGPFYSKLADAVLKERVACGPDWDAMAFIVLNWDILLDNAIYKAYYGHPDKEIANCRIDYCCYTTPIEMPHHMHNSIEVKRQGYYNVKVQKLHGSMNWIYCSNCGVLYYKMGEKIVMWEIDNIRLCPHCETNTLKPVVIEPTFIKDLNNTHLKMVWHNALIDLMEADRVVFIGYSLPLADFDLRYLLKKGINRKAKIEVVLWDDNTFDNIKNSYKSFFGSQINDADISKDGSGAFLAKEFGFDFDPVNDCAKRI